MDAPALQLNSSHPAEFEFDVQVQGLNPAAVPDVRFVISLPLFALCFACSRLSPTKWKVTIPVLEGVFTEVSYPFAVEVIADGYHFQPAAGTIVVISNPKVAVGQTRPTAAVTVEPSKAAEAAAALTPALADLQDRLAKVDAEPQAESAPTAVAVFTPATLLQQVQQEVTPDPLPVVTESELLAAALEAADEPDVPLAWERVEPAPAVEPAPVVEEAPTKPKLSIFKLKKLGQVTR